MLRSVRQTGFAEEHGDVTTGFDSFAVPVFDYNGFPIAGLALTFVAGSLDASHIDMLKRRLMRAGADLSRLLGNSDVSALHHDVAQ